MTTPNTDSLATLLCIVLHGEYELAAVENGWRTQDASRTDWANLPEANKSTMVAAVRAMLEGPLSDLSVLVQIPKVRELVEVADRCDVNWQHEPELADWRAALEATEVTS